jgi:hypothetical protein
MKSSSEPGSTEKAFVSFEISAELLSLLENATDLNPPGGLA